MTKEALSPPDTPLNAPPTVDKIEAHLPRELRELTRVTAMSEIGDGDYLLVNVPGYTDRIAIVAAMGSKHHGTDMAKVGDHNLRIAKLKPPANILLANYRIEHDPQRLKYRRECRFRGDFARHAEALAAKLNAAEPEEDVWRVRIDGEWTVVYSGDPEHSRMEGDEPVFSAVGGRAKTEHLLKLLLKELEV